MGLYMGNCRMRRIYSGFLALARSSYCRVVVIAVAAELFFIRSVYTRSLDMCLRVSMSASVCAFLCLAPFHCVAKRQCFLKIKSEENTSNLGIPHKTKTYM